MSGYPDDRFEEPRRRSSSVVDQARGAVAAPAVFLVMNGLFGLFLLAMISIPTVFDTDSLVDGMKDFVAQQPPGPEKQKAEQQVADFENNLKANRDAFVTQNVVGIIIGVVFNGLAILGGIMMRSLSGYGLCMTGAIITMLPCTTGCCCTGCPFGLWALLILTRPDVRQGFVAANSPTDMDDGYLR
jgi:hypothetical protein